MNIPVHIIVRIFALERTFKTPKLIIKEYYDEKNQLDQPSVCGLRRFSINTRPRNIRLFSIFSLLK
jgi:hypothetical protein